MVITLLLVVAIVGLVFAARPKIKHNKHDPYIQSKTLSPHSEIYSFMEHNDETNQNKNSHRY